VSAVASADRGPLSGRAGMWCRRLTGAIVLGLVVASPANAISIRELRALEASDKVHGPDFVQYYLIGAMEGALEANARSVRSGAQALFCLNGRRLEPRMAKPLFDAELKRNSGIYEADMPVQLVLLNALSTAYTC
jgi:hypothetical protein